MYGHESAKNTRHLWLAYLFWAFLGAAGAHRFYLGHDKTAVAMLVLSIVGLSMTPDHIVGMTALVLIAAWLLLDTFLLPIMLKKTETTSDAYVQWGRDA